MGIVSDSTGAAIPNVGRHHECPSGVSYSTLSNPEGLYRTGVLNPGLYQLTFEGAGFKKLVPSNIQAHTSETL